MKKLLTFSIVIILIVANVSVVSAKENQSQNTGNVSNMIAANNGELGVIFDYIYEFNNGIAKVEKDNKFGFINEQGEIIIPLIYDYAEDFDRKGKFAYVYKGDKKVIIDPTGKEIKGDYKYDSLLTQNQWEALIDSCYAKMNNNFGNAYLYNEKKGINTKKYSFVGYKANYYGDIIFYGSNANKTYDIYDAHLNIISKNELIEIGSLDKNGRFVALSKDRAYVYDCNGEKLEAKEFNSLTDDYIRGFDEYEHEFIVNRGNGVPLSKNIYQSLSFYDISQIGNSNKYDFNNIIFGKVKDVGEIHIINIRSGDKSIYKGEIYDHSMSYQENTVRFLEKVDDKLIYRILNSDGKNIGNYTRSYGFTREKNKDTVFSYGNSILITNEKKIELDKEKVEENRDILNNHIANQYNESFYNVSFLNKALIFSEYKDDSFYEFLIRQDSENNPTLSFRSINSLTNEWETDYKKLSLILELLMAYSDDGEEIFDYFYKNCLSGNIEYNQRVKLGKTNVYVTDPISIQGDDDDGLNDFELHIINNPNTDLKKLDYKKIEMDSVVQYDKVSIIKSNLQRKGSTTLEEDIKLLNKNLGNFSYQFDEYGRLGTVTTEGVIYDRNVVLGLEITRNDNDKPQIRITEWALLEKMQANMKNGTSMAYWDMTTASMCLTSDVLKYYFKSPGDADLFLNWINQKAKNYENIDMSLTYQFGDTIIKITETEFNDFGFYINIIN